MMELGVKVKDKVTGFTGVVIGRAQYLYGCEWVQVAPQAIKDGRPVSPIWMDEQRFDVVNPPRKRVQKERAYTKRGGPNDAPMGPEFPRG